MDRAPLPPHERPWRHPSELGPPEHEPTSSGGKALIVTTATLGLLLVGVLAISMTPDRSGAPESAASTISGLRTAPPSAVALEQRPLPMVTPLGDDGWAVTTMSALGGRVGNVQARLPSGDVVEAAVVATDRTSGITLVSVPAAAGYDLAGGAEPSPSDTVLVNGDPPVVVTMAQLADLDVDEATPVLDEHGDLIGLCTWDRDEVLLRTVATMPAVRTTTTTPTTTRPTTRPTTTPTVPVGTFAPSTSAPTATTGPVAPSSTSTVTTTSVASTTAPESVTATTGRVSGAGASTTAPG